MGILITKNISIYGKCHIYTEMYLTKNSGNSVNFMYDITWIVSGLIPIRPTNNDKYFNAIKFMYSKLL